MTSRISLRNRAVKEETKPQPPAPNQTIPMETTPTKVQSAKSTPKLKMKTPRQRPQSDVDAEPVNLKTEDKVGDTNHYTPLGLNELPLNTRDKIVRLISDEIDETRPSLSYWKQMKEVKDDPESLKKIFKQTVLVIPGRYQDHHPPQISVRPPTRRPKVEPFETRRSSVAQRQTSSSSSASFGESRARRMTRFTRDSFSEDQTPQSQQDERPRRLKMSRDQMNDRSSGARNSKSAPLKRSTRSSGVSQTPSSKVAKPKKSRIFRTKTGCWTCRLRRKRCPEEQPICNECIRLGIECFGYGATKPEFMSDAELMRKKMDEMKAITTLKRRDSREWKNTKKTSRMKVQEVETLYEKDE